MYTLLYKYDFLKNVRSTGVPNAYFPSCQFSLFTNELADTFMRVQ